jgi:hypothetical protein
MPRIRLAGFITHPVPTAVSPVAENRGLCTLGGSVTLSVRAWTISRPPSLIVKPPGIVFP